MGLRVFEKPMAENHINLGKDINLQVQEAERTPNRINPKVFMPRHITVNLKTKDSENKSRKQARELMQEMH